MSDVISGAFDVVFSADASNVHIPRLHARAVTGAGRAFFAQHFGAGAVQANNIPRDGALKMQTALRDAGLLFCFYQWSDKELAEVME